jgi:plastocyanin
MRRYADVSGFLLALVGVPLHAATVRVHVADHRGQPVADAVVEVVGLQADARASAAVLDQRELAFVPRVLAVRRGGTVRFLNGDRVNHHVYSFSPAKRFDLRLAKGAEGTTLHFDAAGTVVVGCNIHDWMLGYIRVVEGAHFAVTGADGSASFDFSAPLPDGAKVLAWHPRFADPEGVVSGPLTPVARLATTRPLKPDPWPSSPGYR